MEQIYADPAFPSEGPVLDEPMPYEGISRADLWSFAAILATEVGLEQNNKNCAVDRWDEKKSSLVHPVCNQQHNDAPCCL